MSPYYMYRAYCPLCGQQMYEKRVRSGTPTPCGDPRITCPHCGRETVDTNVLELALRPKQWYRDHYMKRTVYIPLMLLPFALILAFGLIGMQFEVVRRLPVLALVFVFILLFILGIVPAIRYMNGRCDVRPDTVRFETDYRKSEERLRDPEYRQFLRSSGYLEKKGVTERL